MTKTIMTTTRISDRFAACKADGRPALVTYVMAGDPDLQTSLDILHALRDNGADVIEIGAPFTDPMADGPTIQRAGLRSLAHGTKLRDVLELARRFRETDDETPLILMGYANPVHAMGYEAFADAAAAAGLDGTILVDLPPEEDAELRAAYARHDLSVIRLATPTTTPERMKAVCDGASGFVYYVSVAGVTGAAKAEATAVSEGIALARRVSGLPVCVGFGIRTGEDAARLAPYADGIVVGSAFIDRIADCIDRSAGDQAASKVGELAAELSAALTRKTAGT